MTAAMIEVSSAPTNSVQVGIDVEIRGSFRGPLDLLLAIVRQNRFPLEQLPLGEITRQFERYLQMHRTELETDDLDAGSAFFETASWLVLLKSRALLPASVESEAPAEELRRVLLDHAQLQALGAALGERLEETGIGAGKPDGAFGTSEGVGIDGKVDTADSPKVPTVHDALLAAREAMAVARAHAAVGPQDPGLSVGEAAALLECRLAALAPGVVLDTREWLTDAADPGTRVAVLLALLELARLGRLLLHQRELFAHVLCKAPAGRI